MSINSLHEMVKHAEEENMQKEAQEKEFGSPRSTYPTALGALGLLGGAAVGGAGGRAVSRMVDEPRKAGMIPGVIAGGLAGSAGGNMAGHHLANQYEQPNKRDHGKNKALRPKAE